MKQTKKALQQLFLDYFNNFLTRERFAEYYGISLERANRIIEVGRYFHNKSVERWKNGTK